jgi:hypothetical protein
MIMSPDKYEGFLFADDVHVAVLSGMLADDGTSQSWQGSGGPGDDDDEFDYDYDDDDDDDDDYDDYDDD